MKARRSKTIHPHAFDQSVNRRLVSYATAAAAAGAGLLGLAQPADAQIVYTPAHVVIPYNSGYALDLANNGTTDFILHGSVTSNCSTVFSQLLAKPVIGNALEAKFFYSESLARALPAGARIGPGDRFLGQQRRRGILMGEAIYSPGGGQVFGSWVRAANRYLGLKFHLNGQAHYGWARLSANLGLQHRMQVLLTGYAYETQPDTPIVAGQETETSGGLHNGALPAGKNSPPAAALRQPSLGALALGAPGLALWRRDPQETHPESAPQG